MRASDLHLQRSTETLLGYLKGITCDDHLNDEEIARLQGWLESHHALRAHWPFDELSARLEAILRDSVRGRRCEFTKTIVPIMAKRVQR